MTKVLFLLCYHSKLHTPKTDLPSSDSSISLCYHSKLHTPKTKFLSYFILIELCYHSKLHTPKTICVQHPEHKKLCYHSKLHTPKTSILHFLLPFIFLTKMRFQPHILNLSKIQFQTITYHLNNFTSTYILLYKKIIKILVYKKYSLSFQRRNL